MYRALRIRARATARPLMIAAIAAGCVAAFAGAASAAS